MYAVLLVVAALDAAGYGIIAPVVPAIAAETGVGPGAIGALVATFAVGMAAGFVLGGWGVQRRGASAVLVASLALVAVGSLGFVAGGGFWVYAGARLVMGVGSGGLWMGVVFGVMERFPGAEYRRLTGVLAAYSIGGVAGPGLGGLGGVQAPFGAFAAIVLVATVVILAARTAAAPVAFGSDRRVLRSPSFRLATAAVTLLALCVGILDGPLPLHFGERLSQGEIAALYVSASLLIGVSSIVAGRFAPRAALVVAVALMPLGLAIAAASDSVAVWIGAIGLFALAFGLGDAGALGVLLETAGTGRIVLAMVVWSQLWAVGYLVGPAVGGLLAEALGFGALGLVPAAAAAVVLAALAQSRRSAVTPA